MSSHENQTDPKHVGTVFTDAEKIFGISRLWQEVRYNFAFFDQVPELDWDESFKEFIPQVLEAKSLVEYYRILQKFCALLKDLHTSIYPPQEFFKCFDRPRIEVQDVQRRAIVLNVGNSLKDAIPRGSEILAVEGTPVETYLKTEILPYISSSTEHALWGIGIWGLLEGPIGTEFTITIRTPGGQIQDVKVMRNSKTFKEEWFYPVEKHEDLEFKWLEDGISYVALNSFGNDGVVKQFENFIPDLQRSRGFILDVRRNGGGSSTVATPILRHLIDRPVDGGKWKTHEHRAAFKAWGKLFYGFKPGEQEKFAEAHPQFWRVIEIGKPYFDGTAWYEESTEPIEPYDVSRITCPFVVLIGRGTCSAAESFLIPLDSLERATLVGQETVGSTGQPLTFGLPGGGSARICTVKPLYSDGREFVGYGVSPDIYVEPTVEDFLNNRDVIFEKGVEILKQKMSSKAKA